MMIYSCLLVAAILVGTLLQPSETACTHKGVEYQTGQSVPVDSCNNCRCWGNYITCTLMACPEHLGMCRKNGVWYRSGTSVPSDDCNTCTCANGNIACTLMACPPPQ